MSENLRGGRGRPFVLSARGVPTALAAAVVAVSLCAALAGIAASGAAAATAPIAGEVEARDRLIADQENLLNAYRCLYAVDVQAVPGGCPNPDQVSPGPAPPNPTQADIDARDALIAAQEALLNTYRCNHNIDTQLVPDGCQNSHKEPIEAEEPPKQNSQCNVPPGGELLTIDNKHGYMLCYVRADAGATLEPVDRDSDRINVHKIYGYCSAGWSPSNWDFFDGFIDEDDTAIICLSYDPWLDAYHDCPVEGWLPRSDGTCKQEGERDYECGSFGVWDPEIEYDYKCVWR